MFRGWHVEYVEYLYTVTEQRLLFKRKRTDERWMQDPDLVLISFFNFWPPCNEDRSYFLEDVPNQASYISTPISFLESPRRGTTSSSKPAHQPVQLFIVFMLRLHKANSDSVILRFFTNTAVAWVIKSSPPCTAIHHSFIIHKKLDYQLIPCHQIWVEDLPKW